MLKNILIIIYPILIIGIWGLLIWLTYQSTKKEWVVRVVIWLLCLLVAISIILGLHWLFIGMQLIVKCLI